MSATNDVTLSFKLPYKLKQAVRKKAKLANLTQTDFMNELLDSCLDEFNPPMTALGSKYKTRLITHNTEK